ncbi:hypothetical protein JOE30_001415 [Rhodococcus sp. PvP016]|nr:hypothetical protein [Rhodococcus sp. PvP016]
MGTTTLARSTLAAHCTPVQYDDIAGANIDDTGTDRLDCARCLVTEEKRIVVVDSAVAVGEVGVAHPAGDDVDDDLARSGIRDDDVGHLDWRAVATRNCATHYLTHVGTISDVK